MVVRDLLEVVAHVCYVFLSFLKLLPEGLDIEIISRRSSVACRIDNSLSKVVAKKLKSTEN